ncbi:MAG: AsmA-like C-terminal domain-containing protein [Tagaea sp.]
MADLTTERLVELWPVFAPPNPVIWIAENIAGGRVPQARAELELAARDADWTGVTLPRFRLDFAVRGADVTYVHGLPPARGVDATAVMDARRLDLRVSSGAVGGIRIEEGTVALTGLDQYQQYAQIDVRLAAPVPEAMRLIDMEPLGFLKRIDERPDNFDGAANVRLTTRFPLLADLKLDSLDIRAEAQARNFVMRRAVMGQPLENGEMTVRVDQNGLDVRGRASLAGSPAEIVYRREFSATANPIERATARGRASAGTQARLNLDFPPYLDGPVDVELSTVATRDGRRTVDLVLDLQRAALSLPEIEWKRDAGAALGARLQVLLRGDAVTEIRNIDASGPGIALRGRIGFAPDGRTMTDIEFSRAAIEGRLDLSALRVRRDPSAAGGRGRNVFEARGAFFDAEVFLKDKSPPDPNRPDFALRGQFERLRLGEDRELRAVTIDARRGQRLWERMHLEARLDPSVPGASERAPFVFSLEPEPDGMQRLAASSPDAGAVLKALDITPNVVGGRLVARGRTDPARHDQAIAGSVNIQDFRVVKAPAMAKLLSVALLTGVLDSLRGEGIGFRRLDADFAWADPAIEIKDGRMYGASIGVTASGKVDLEAETLDLSGTIVPAYAVNSILGNIPILGDLLAGERGGGIFAANYVARGATGEPDVRINPLSTLAPGFLRRLFGGFAGGGTPAPAPGPADRFDPTGGTRAPD